ncbi:hypothetical protein [Streptomyces sp. SAS_272]|uniref:hypothetical protein n=1 Tax=Streptomyces sp. SAS_272 TaxID=3412747 RepID=UPI00403D1A96
MRKRFLHAAALSLVAVVATSLPAHASTAPDVPRASTATTAVSNYVSSPLSYEYDYSLGSSFFYTGESVMSGAARTFLSTFPVPANCGSYSQLPPAQTPPVRCNLSVGPLWNPIAVVSRTTTSFGFLSLPGHAEGADRNIRFTFYRTPTFELRMRVEGWGPWTLGAATSISTGVVNTMWQTYANTLRTEISNGRL